MIWRSMGGRSSAWAARRRLRARRAIIREANCVGVHVYEGELQFIFWGADGLAVVNRALEITNCSGHLKPGGAEKAFLNMKRTRLWLRPSERG